jgi:transcriptional regulator with XRE-family HTH domain
MTSKNASVRQRRVSGELRALRKAKGRTCDEVARAIGCSESKISRLETGGRGLNADDVSAILGYLEAPARLRHELVSLVREGEVRNWHTADGHQLANWMDLIRFEREAARLRNYEPLVIPGLAQTADYARTIIRGSNDELSDAEVDSRVAIRMSRRAVLSSTEVHLFIDESVLHRTFGDQPMMRAQLHHLGALATRANVVVQVVAHGMVAYRAIGGSFVLIDFVDHPSLVYVESLMTSSFLEEERHIHRARLAWQELRALALSRDDSARLIAEIAGKST